jgi:hypothetical protein
MDPFIANLNSTKMFITLSVLLLSVGPKANCKVTRSKKVKKKKEKTRRLVLFRPQKKFSMCTHANHYAMRKIYVPVIILDAVINNNSRSSIMKGKSIPVTGHGDP